MSQFKGRLPADAKTAMAEFVATEIKVSGKQEQVVGFIY